MQDNYLRKIYIGAAALFAIIITTVLVIFLIIVPAIKNANRPAFLDILVAPVDANVMIDGEEYRNAVYEMEPGHYTATITKEGFIEKNKTAGLYLYMEPTDGNWDFYKKKENQDSLEALLRLNNYNSDGATWRPEVAPIQEKDGAKEIAEKYKVKTILPVNVSLCATVLLMTSVNKYHHHFQENLLEPMYQNRMLVKLEALLYQQQ